SPAGPPLCARPRQTPGPGRIGTRRRWRSRGELKVGQELGNSARGPLPVPFFLRRIQLARVERPLHVFEGARLSCGGPAAAGRRAAARNATPSGRSSDRKTSENGAAARPEAVPARSEERRV